MESRIRFPGNPWPNGHRIKKFEWTADVKDGDLWFYFHLETDDYRRESEGTVGAGDRLKGDWTSSTVWTNFGRCTISATAWGDEVGFRVGRFSKFNLDRLSGREFIVDRLPFDADDDDYGRAFHIYLLGHDAVADHLIKFNRNEKSGLFDITWTGRIALAYLGDDEFKHSFEARIYGIEAPVVLKKGRLLRLIPWLGPKTT